MAILASNMLSVVGVDLSDDTHVRWTADELIGYINEGQRAIVFLRPDATQTTKAVQLAAGVSQAIPADGYKFLRLFENMGPLGTARGRVIQFRDLDAKDRHAPTWRAATPGTEVLEYMTDSLVRTGYYVSPPVHPTTAVWANLQYSRYPVDVPLSTGNPAYNASIHTLDLPDIYQPHIREYVLFRCHSKDTQEADPGRAQRHGQQFLAIMGAKARSDVLYSPITRDRPYADTAPRPEAVNN